MAASAAALLHLHAKTSICFSSPSQARLEIRQAIMGQETCSSRLRTGLVANTFVVLTLQSHSTVRAYHPQMLLTITIKTPTQKMTTTIVSFITKQMSHWQTTAQMSHWQTTAQMSHWQTTAQMSHWQTTAQMSHWQSMAQPWIANATPKPSEAR